MKHITKELLKNANYRRKFQNMLKEIFTGVPKYSILHKERKKNKQTKYNTADHAVVQHASC